jgi:glycosyltransferase involved in cell wall biosynthesis
MKLPITEGQGASAPNVHAMALRITSAALPEQPETPIDPAVAELERAHLIGVRAAPLLAQGDTVAYLALFKEASAFGHELRRYYAHRVLLEQGFAALAKLNDRSAVTTLLAMAHGIVAILQADPSQPVMLNYGGVIFYELWSLNAAQSLFDAAARLDPALPHLERNIQSLRERQRARRQGQKPLHPALMAVSRRALALAAKAKPATGQRLSLCMIVKDEEDMLPRCLEAIAPVVDEMIIVDTGSTDATVEIARSFGATVIERGWTGDFSEARNVSLDAATGDWFMYLDADEVLVAEDVDKLRELLSQPWYEAFFFNETNFTGHEEHGSAVVHTAMRLMRNRPEYRFHGRLHEQIAGNLPSFATEKLGSSQVRVNHYGYLGVVRDAKAKSERNIELLLKQREEQPDSAFLRYNLGAEYLVTGETERAIEEFEISWRLVTDGEIMRGSFVPSLAWRLLKAQRIAGRHEESLTRAEEFLERFPGFTDLVFEQGHAALALGREDEAYAYFEKCIEMGDAPSRYTAQVGAGTFLPRTILALRHIARGEHAEAVAQMRWCADHNPEFFGIIHPYATALLRSGMEPAEAAAEVESKLKNVSPTSRFMLGTALYEFGAAPQAEAQFRGVLERQPHSGPARAALAEALLYQSKYAESAAVAAAMDPAEGLAIVAIRSEIFARLLAHDLDGATTALARAPSVGLPAGDIALYRSWLARLRSESALPVPQKALPLMELILESLLRVQDFANFEVALGILAAIEGQSDRERRERLALIYMRRGFVKSAAREWLTVCQERPDPPALLGLARVALATDRAESAITLAQQVLVLDPGNSAAAEIIDKAPQPAAA